MFLKYLHGNTVYLDETEGDGSDAGGGSDRGDGFEGKEDEELEVEAKEDEDEGVEKTAAEKAEAEKKEKEEKDKKAKMVPHARMKEAVEKERAAREKSEKRAQDAEDKLAAANKGVDLDKLGEEIEALDEKLDKAIADGDVAAKKLFRKELREKQMTLARAEAAALSAQATAVAVERVRYDALVERMEVEYPAMNPDHEDYDEDVVAEIVELKEAYEAKGQSSTEALKKAAKYILKGKTVEKKADAEDEDAQKKAEEDLREKAVKKAQDAKGKQPPSADKGGKPSDKSGGNLAKNIGKITDVEFDKLDAKEKARLRGDEV